MPTWNAEKICVSLQTTMAATTDNSSKSSPSSSALASSFASGTNLHSVVDQDGKKVDAVPIVGVLGSVFVVMPIWVSVVMPLSITYQLGKAIVSTVIGKGSNDALASESNIDSGYQVTKDDIIPRKDRKYDLIVLGATGFTGKLAARHLAKTYGVKKTIQWAIAGRSQSKLEDVKKSLATELGLDEVLELDTIVVDTSVPSTVPNLVRNTRAVVTTVGPFCVYGNHVVEFCAKFGTHYADITGETPWAKLMMKKWQGTAKETGARILSFCGFDSVPWDISVYKLAQQLKKERDGEELVSVKFMDELKGGVSGGSLATMTLATQGKIPSAPKSSLEDPFCKTATGGKNVNPITNNVPLSISSLAVPWDGTKMYSCASIMAAVNIEVVGWTQCLSNRPSLSYSEISLKPNFASAFVEMLTIAFLVSSLLNPVTSYVLRNYILPEPGAGPSMKNMQEEYFASVYCQGVGDKGSKIESILYNPRCAGYLDTGRMLVECGLSLAVDEGKLPSTEDGGGFYSPAYALGDILLDRLTKTGTHFALAIKK